MREINAWRGGKAKRGLGGVHQNKSNRHSGQITLNKRLTPVTNQFDPGDESVRMWLRRIQDVVETGVLVPEVKQLGTRKECLFMATLCKFPDLLDVAETYEPDSPRKREKIKSVNSHNGEYQGGFPFEKNKIHLADCIESMKQIPTSSVDIAIADPPYNASKGNNWKWDNSIKLPGFGGKWSKIMADWDDMPLYDYFMFSICWISELKRIVRPTGSIWIHGTYHNVGIINFALQLLSVEIINEVVWYKRNSFPNLSGRRLTASHETILWAHTGSEKKRRYFFDYDVAKATCSPEDFLKQPGKQMRTVWDIPNNKKKEELSFGKHPAQKPVRLIKRMLEISACPGNFLLVPFAGSGTDCVAAREMGIHFLGFDNNPDFVHMGNKRVSSVMNHIDSTSRNV